MRLIFVAHKTDLIFTEQNIILISFFFSFRGEIWPGHVLDRFGAIHPRTVSLLFSSWAAREKRSCWGNSVTDGRERRRERENGRWCSQLYFWYWTFTMSPLPSPSRPHTLSLSLQIQPFLFLNAPLSLDRAYKPSDIFLSPFDSRFLVIVPQHLIYSKEPPFSHSSGFNDWLLL